MEYADLFQLCGILAVRVAGGPFIQFTPGQTCPHAQLNHDSMHAALLHLCLFAMYRSPGLQSNAPSRPATLLWLR